MRHIGVTQASPCRTQYKQEAPYTTIVDQNQVQNIQIHEALQLPTQRWGGPEVTLPSKNKLSAAPW